MNEAIVDLLVVRSDGWMCELAPAAMMYCFIQRDLERRMDPCASRTLHRGGVVLLVFVCLMFSKFRSDVRGAYHYLQI